MFLVIMFSNLLQLCYYLNCNGSGFFFLPCMLTLQSAESARFWEVENEEIDGFDECRSGQSFYWIKGQETQSQQ